MAEVGLLPFARIAMQVCKAVLPRYRSRFSKRQFNQPQLLAILCLMRCEDWTFREAEVRLGEHRELRQALGLVSVPDFTTLYRFLQRLDDQVIDLAVGETVRRLRGTRKKGQRRAPRCGRCDGLGAGSGQHVLCAAHASSRAKTAAVAALAEMGSGGGPGSAVSVVADRATRPLERLCQFASGRPSRFPANAHRAGAGRRRVRQREEPYLHPATTRGAQRDPRQAWKENLAHPWSARPDATSIPATTLPPPIPDREPVQFGESQALGSCAGSLAAHAEASSSAARTEFQSVPPEASPTFLEDVNRARWLLVSRAYYSEVRTGPLEPKTQSRAWFGCACGEEHCEHNCSGATGIGEMHRHDSGRHEVCLCLRRQLRQGTGNLPQRRYVERSHVCGH